MPSSKWIGAALLATGLAIGALIPVFLVLYPAAGLGPDSAGKPGVLLPVVARTPGLFVGPGIVEIAGHVIGALAVLGIWFRWGRDSFLLTCATVAGAAWMTIDTIDNAISIQLVPSLAAAFASGDATAATTFGVVGQLTDALRLAGHLGGGLWIIGSRCSRCAHASPIPSSLGLAWPRGSCSP
jgi:hypothetical protein